MNNQDHPPCGHSNTKRASSPSPPLNTVQYGPITVRICQKAIPTLETGRRSKDLVLFGDAAIKREKNREKNREAAKKIKQKRQSIEDELNENIRELEHQQSLLQGHVQQLHLQKERLVFELNNQDLDEIDQILFDASVDAPIAEKQYSPDTEFVSDALEDRINAR